ncbi:MAG: hypothetical protein CLLPBCKN_006597 [Chroococcidiopsis cubana SAG 39.79]|nr:hypothetical protein [Chroococcidiopsis cubana SAG 39.79]
MTQIVDSLPDATNSVFYVNTRTQLVQFKLLGLQIFLTGIWSESYFSDSTCYLRQ